MSNALVIVTFKSGLKLYTQYQGSSDTFYPALFSTDTEAWSYSRANEKEWCLLTRTEPVRSPEPVHVLNKYGGTSENYFAYACKETRQLRVLHDWLNDTPESIEQFTKRILRE